MFKATQMLWFQLTKSLHLTKGGEWCFCSIASLLHTYKESIQYWIHDVARRYEIRTITEQTRIEEHASCIIDHRHTVYLIKKFIVKGINYAYTDEWFNTCLYWVKQIKGDKSPTATVKSSWLMMKNLPWPQCALFPFNVQLWHCFPIRPWDSWPMRILNGLLSSN